MSLADAYRDREAPERKEALADAAAYRKILKRRYGDDKLPMERAMEGAKVLTLYDLQKLKLSEDTPETTTRAHGAMEG